MIFNLFCDRIAMKFCFLFAKTSLEERLSKNQNLLTSLRSSMGEKVWYFFKNLSIKLTIYSLLGCKDQTSRTRISVFSIITSITTDKYTSNKHKSSISKSTKISYSYSTTITTINWSTSKNKSTVGRGELPKKKNFSV